MHPEHLLALPHPLGNRIDLRWSNPEPAKYRGVRVVRREGTYPTGPRDGALVAEGAGLVAAVDPKLRAETVYYYSLFPYSGDPPQYADTHSRVSAMATGSYDFAGLMYELLPALYRRYDAPRRPAPGAAVDPVDRDRGVLRRFLDLPGSQLDQLYSFARAALSLHDVDRVDGRLLPLLAQWIGWRTDHGLPLRAQRNEIRFAPDLYRALGAVPTVTATASRVTGRPARVKEYVHNVARTNQPEQLNLWALTRPARGAWREAQLTSMNVAHDGAVAHVREPNGDDLFLYHCLRRSGWDIWAKGRADGTWRPSGPLVSRPGVDKYPAAAMQADRLWLFWNGWDPAGPVHWRMWFRTRTGDTWSEPEVLPGAEGHRRNPAAVVDDAGGLWLFWRELSGTAWRIRYNRHDGTRWQLDPPATMPDDAGAPVWADDDLVALFHPTGAGRLWLFWARQEPGGPTGQRRWSVAWRVKGGLDPGTGADWSPVRTVPKADAGDHDREPAPLATPEGNVELFWASTRAGDWALVRAELDVSTASWGPAEQIGGGPFTSRAPLAVTIENGETLLVYRSNRSLTYGTGSPRTLDTRFAGTTTVRAGDRAKLALRGRFEDVLTYTYEHGGRGRIARDAVGVFLAPGHVPTELTGQAPARLADVLPVTVRAFVIPS